MHLVLLLLQTTLNLCWLLCVARRITRLEVNSTLVLIQRMTPLLQPPVVVHRSFVHPSQRAEAYYQSTPSHTEPRHGIHGRRRPSTREPHTPASRRLGSVQPPTSRRLTAATWCSRAAPDHAFEEKNFWNCCEALSLSLFLLFPFLYPHHGLHTHKRRERRQRHSAR